MNYLTRTRRAAAHATSGFGWLACLNLVVVQTEEGRVCLEMLRSLATYFEKAPFALPWTGRFSMTCLVCEDA